MSCVFVSFVSVCVRVCVCEPFRRQSDVIEIQRLIGLKRARYVVKFADATTAARFQESSTLHGLFAAPHRIHPSALASTTPGTDAFASQPLQPNVGATSALPPTVVQIEAANSKSVAAAVPTDSAERSPPALSPNYCYYADMPSPRSYMDDDTAVVQVETVNPSTVATASMSTDLTDTSTPVVDALVVQPSQPSVDATSLSLPPTLQTETLTPNTVTTAAVPTDSAEHSSPVLSPNYCYYADMPSPRS